MNGETLKTRLESLGYTKAYIAEKLGVLPQNIQTWFKAEDVKTGTLEKLSEVLDVPIAYFFGDSYNVAGNNNATGSHNVVNATDDRLLSLLIAKDEQLTLSMKQTTTAQEQMSRILDKFCR